MKKYYFRHAAEGAKRRGEIFLEAATKDSAFMAKVAFTQALKLLEWIQLSTIDSKDAADEKNISEIRAKLSLMGPKQREEKGHAKKSLPGLVIPSDHQTHGLDLEEKTKPLPASSSATSLQHLSFYYDADASVSVIDDPLRSPSPLRSTVSAAGSISSTQSLPEQTPSPTTATSAKGSRMESPLLKRGVSSQQFATSTPTHFTSQSTAYTQLDKAPKHKRQSYSLSGFFHFPTATVEAVEDQLGENALTLGRMKVVPETVIDEKAESPPQTPLTPLSKKMG